MKILERRGLDSPSNGIEPDSTAPKEVAIRRTPARDTTHYPEGAARSNNSGLLVENGPDEARRRHPCVCVGIAIQPSVEREELPTTFDDRDDSPTIGSSSASRYL
jgi:hypothetical protein